MVFDRSFSWDLGGKSLEVTQETGIMFHGGYGQVHGFHGSVDIVGVCIG